MHPSPPHIRQFSLSGRVEPVVALRKGGGIHYQPHRRLEGWLITYGKIGPRGGITPTVDREDQVFEAARELGHIDWTGYLEKGLWNDTHNESVIVGIPTGLEFHDESTQLAKAHRKVGYYTAGHLWDPDDARSWTDYGNYTPTPHDLERANHYWELATLLKGEPRGLGLSAHGFMALSPCKKRITYAKVLQAAVCELPMNPDATLDLAKATAAGLELLRKGISGSACGQCQCMSKAMTVDTLAPVAPEDLENATADEKMEWLVARIAERFRVSVADARRWVTQHLLSSRSEDHARDEVHDRRADGARQHHR